MRKRSSAAPRRGEPQPRRGCFKLIRQWRRPGAARLRSQAHQHHRPGGSLRHRGRKRDGECSITADINAGRPVEGGASTGEKRRIDAVVKPGVAAGDDGRAGIAGIFNIWRGEGDVVVALRVVQKRKRDFAATVARDAGPVEGVELEDLRADVTAGVGHQKSRSARAGANAEKRATTAAAHAMGERDFGMRTDPVQCATAPRRCAR
jgi:hypothetical protein